MEIKASFIAATVLSLNIGHACASTQIPWDQVGASYTQTELSNSDSYKGFRIHATALLSENVLFTGSYKRVKDSFSSFVVMDDVTQRATVDSTLDDLRVGLGYKYRVFDNTDWVNILAYNREEIEVSTRGLESSVSDNGVLFSTGLRSMISDSVELSGSIGYREVWDNDVFVNLGSQFHLFSNISFGLGYEWQDDIDSYEVSIHWSF
ncbi:outer membrane beta-barrel protein [Thalassotalea ponticola]|uniref:outer membrane beta-barrel protein n=1 Tax=Thalassotalea ponticola TaxID=1523392 RepID=UPI0025B4035D|nr:outer membrane beta-barrel protein [Thalassotalea ponticola]MDN3651626.1 outer membrane beta-barrel protein [Thalassotalea ponticola]